MKGVSWQIDCYRMCLPICMSNVGVCWTITKCWWIAWTRCSLMDSDDCTLCLTWVWQGDNGSIFPNASHRDWTYTEFAAAEQGMKIHENINRRGFKTKWICGECPRSYVCELWESKDCMRRVIKCICEKWCPSQQLSQLVLGMGSYYSVAKYRRSLWQMCFISSKCVSLVNVFHIYLNVFFKWGGSF